MWLPVSVTGAAEAIYEAATGMLTKSDMDRIADRRARLEQRKAEIHQRNEDLAAEASKRAPLHRDGSPTSSVRCWSRRHPAGRRPEQHALSCRPTTGRSQPSTYFKSGGSTGGWGSSAAFGAKLAKPNSDVVLASGDGYFMFGTPLAGLWAAGHHGAPYLAVVFVNASYSTGTRGLRARTPTAPQCATAATRAGSSIRRRTSPSWPRRPTATARRSPRRRKFGPALRRGLEPGAPRHARRHRRSNPHAAAGDGDAGWRRGRVGRPLTGVVAHPMDASRRASRPYVPRKALYKSKPQTPDFHGLPPPVGAGI